MTDQRADFLPGKTGKRPPLPDRPKLWLGDYLRTIDIPDHPAVEPAPKLSWPMYLNADFGTCVPAGWGHNKEAVHMQLGVPFEPYTDAEIEAFYRTQNPQFDPATDADDNGMNIQVFLEYLRKRGDILAFAAVDHRNVEEMRAAMYLFLSVMFGVVLTQANMDQFSAGHAWDYVAGSENVGGHCVNGIGYDQFFIPVTWAKAWGMTPQFIAHQLDEAWVPILPAHFLNPTFREGVDGEKLAKDFELITGEPITPQPVPTPTPPPTPPLSGCLDDADVALAKVAKTYVEQHHIGQNHLMQVALRNWIRDKRIDKWTGVEGLA